MKKTMLKSLTLAAIFWIGFAYAVSANTLEECSAATSTIDAVNDFYDTNEDVSLVVPAPNLPYVGILDNDIDTDNATVFEAFSATNAISNSTIDVASDGSFVYVPAPDFSGRDSFDYIICIPDATPICDIGTIVIVVHSCVEIELSVFLEGAYDANAGEMTTFLNLDSGGFGFELHRGILPGQKKRRIESFDVTVTPPFQPYDTAPWNYSGTEGQSDQAPWYLAPGSTATGGDPDYAVYHPDVVDWLLVRFRTGAMFPTDSTVVEKTAAALLLKDGSVVFMEPCVLLAETLASNLVWVQIDHRNHMSIMTPDRIDVSSGSLFWDFRIADSFRTPQSFGQKSISFPDGPWCMYAGDSDQAADMVNYDITGFDNEKFVEENGFYDQYRAGDFNLNADVSGMDKILWFTNNGISNRVPK